MAYFNSDEQEKSILEIQRILRGIDYLDGTLSPIRLTGNYNEETRQGVSNFQKKYGLPITGEVDLTTWQLLQTVNRVLNESTQLARAVYILPREEEYTIYPGLADDVVYVIQHMINVLSQEYDTFFPLEFTGIYDEATENNIREFQRKNLLDESGNIDPITFNRLADEYERLNSYNQ